MSGAVKRDIKEKGSSSSSTFVQKKNWTLPKEILSSYPANCLHDNFSINVNNLR
jgi:hypothetical protein